MAEARFGLLSKPRKWLRPDLIVDIVAEARFNGSDLLRLYKELGFLIVSLAILGGLGYVWGDFRRFGVTLGGLGYAWGDFRWFGVILGGLGHVWGDFRRFGVILGGLGYVWGDFRWFGVRLV